MAERARSNKTASAPANPKAAAAEVPLTRALAQLLDKTLLPDLRRRAADPAVDAALRQRHADDKKARRTADRFDDFCEHLLEQVGAAWILSCVFIRTLEDRELLRQRRLAGPGAADSAQLFRELFPYLGTRDYLRMVLRELSRLPGAADVLGPDKNPAWVLMPSEDAARALLDFFQAPDASGTGLRYTFAGTDTRFLGDLYQDLSASVRERYALLQTPHFVEKFILDQTLEPALERFGLSAVRLLDPTCGSGHFLLGAFDRLFEHHQLQRPALDEKTHAAAALSQIYGCDLNPYAVAIARFRLTLAFLEKAKLTKLHEAPPLTLNLVVADSLLYGAKGRTLSLVEDADTVTRAAWGADLYNLEDPAAAKALFKQGYHAVVGNPPYITCKDSELREHYRTYYKSAAGKYALAAPFTECFFHLAVPDGYVGLINANSFMKREFGKKLIEEVLPRLDLQRIIDTSGAFIPGHGTPTVLLFGQNRAPLAATIPVVMGKRGEPSVPDDAEQGVVWRSIAEHYKEPDFENEYISTREMDRGAYGKHPWSLGGGGVNDLKDHIESNAHSTLETMSTAIGFDAIMGEDELFAGRSDWIDRLGLTEPFKADLCVGESVRDWQINTEDQVIFPYGTDLNPKMPDSTRLVILFWSFKQCLIERRQFGKNTIEAGLQWFEYRSFYKSKRKIPLSITYGEVATHNHFVLDRGGKVFKQTAPIIKLKPDATEEQYLALLGYLNSSMVAFGLRQVAFCKGAGKMGDGGRVTQNPWEDFYAFSGTAISKLPVPDLVPLLKGNETVRRIIRISQEISKCWPSNWVPAFRGTRDELLQRSGRAREQIRQGRESLVAMQEELDWQIYKIFNLADTPFLSSEYGVRPEWRPVEILMAAKDEHADWFQRHKRLPVSSLDDVPLPTEVKSVYKERLALIRNDSKIALLEAPEHKRRWEPLDFDQLLQQSCQAALLSRVEALFKQRDPRAHSTRELASELGHDQTACALAGVLRGESEPDLDGLLRELVPTDSVPYLAALRYSDSGMDKRKKWEQTWALQRRQDAGEDVEIEVPPKYDTKDFRDPVFYRLRGKLDVPKERFIRYPGAERDDDRSPLIGWAGWDHLQRATALAALYHERKTTEGWEAERLVPLLAGVLELVPWLKQWHNEPSPEYGNERLGDYFASFVEGEARGLGVSVADLEAFRPQVKARGRGRAAKSEQAGAEP